MRISGKSSPGVPSVLTIPITMGSPVGVPSDAKATSSVSAASPLTVELVPDESGSVVDASGASVADGTSVVAGTFDSSAPPLDESLLPQDAKTSVTAASPASTPVCR